MCLFLEEKNRMNITSSYGCEFMGEPRKHYPLRSKLYALRERIIERLHDSLTYDEYLAMDARIERFYSDGFGEWPSRNVLRVVDACAKKCIDCKVYIGPSVDYFCGPCGARDLAKVYKRSIKEQKRVVKAAKRELKRQQSMLKEKEMYGRYC